jgi:ABC-type multidrug transport system ATPase subunit
VPQDDVVMPELTVRENILHSARIRLPSSWSDKEIQTHVDILLDCLQLTFIKDNPVGDSINPMISGGQRKRVSIGIELAAAPMALFLDEPTSGLDSTSALSIINLLKALSRLGVTVVCIIHQPRSEIFFALDHLLLLAAGRQVFQGKPAAAIGYFENMGFHVPGHCNPADVIMDVIAGQGRKYSGQAEEIDVPRLIQRWETVESPAQILNATSDGDQMDSLARFATSRGARWYRQVYLCLVRSIKQQWRQANSFYLEVGVGAIAGLLIGLSTLKVEGFLFQGIYHPPYELLSSAVDYTLVPELGLLCSLAIGMAQAILNDRF